MRLVEWSYSRRNTFEQCLQKYYLDYYGSSQRFAQNEQDKVLIRELKLRQNRYARTGELVHAMIASYFRSGEKGIVQSTRSMIEAACRILTDEINLSLRRAECVSGSPGPGLIEFSNAPKQARDFYKEAEQRMVVSLQNFGEHARYEKIRVVGRSGAADIEKRFKLQNFRCRVAGIIDFASRSSGKAAIVDWKSGKPSQSEDDSLQLTAYALWGAQRFGTAPQNVAIYKAFLGSGELIRFPLTETSVEKGKRRICQDVQRMIEMHEYGVIGRRKAFTPCAQPKVCILCPYLTICHEGKESLHDRN